MAVADLSVAEAVTRKNATGDADEEPELVRALFSWICWPKGRSLPIINRFHIHTQTFGEITYLAPMSKERDAKVAQLLMVRY